MNPVFRNVLAGLLSVGVIGQPLGVWAQDAAALPAAVQATEPGADQAVDPAMSTDDDPSRAKSPLVVEPTTPEELFDAVLLMVDISRNSVAKQYLKKFLATDPPDDLLVKLREAHGPAIFLRLANIKELQPESKTLLALNNTAYAKYANDPARLDEFLKDLVTGTQEQQTIATHQIETAGVAIVPALIRALGDPKYSNAQSTLVQMLVRIGPKAVPAMHAALTSPELKTRQSIILALGMIRDERSIPHLLRFAGPTDPTEETEGARKAILRIIGNDHLARTQLEGVASRLLQTARHYFLEQEVWESSSDQLVSTWVWHQPINTVLELRLTPAAASRQYGLFFAKSALDAAPERLDVQTTYLNLLFAEEVAVAGLSKPLKSGPGSTQDLASSLGAEVVMRTLSEAMELQKTESMLMALKVLEKIGTVQQVRTVMGKQSALQRALNYPSRRVQFAAAQTIVTLDPATKYPGTDRVVAILGRSLTQAEASEKPALVLDSVMDRGQMITGFLKDLGYNPTHRQTGREGFLVAANTQELDLILVDANIQRWALSETLSNLKYDPRTMDVPIVIYGEAVTEKTIRVYMKQFPNLLYVEIPATSDDLRRQISPILSRQSEPPLTPDERSTKASRAAELLAFLSSGQRRKLYDFTQIENPLLTSMENPQLAPFLLPVINALPTVAAQKRIAEVAADGGQSNDVRRIAAAQLTLHIRQFGLLISDEQVEQLRSRWEQASDAKLYSELSAVMGSLKPNTTLVGQRLKKVPTAPAPEAVKQ